jgi:acetyl-CoA synthetase/acetyltransferase
LETLGVVVAETPAEAYDIAMVLARSSHTQGSRVAIVTHSGGVAILLADLADRAGLVLDDPSPRLKAVIRQSLDHGSPANPVDMGGIIGGPNRFAEVVGEFGRSGEYDAVLAVTTPHPPAHTIPRVESLLDLRTDATLIHLWMAGDQGTEGLAALRGRGVAVTEEPRAAIRALAGLAIPPRPTRLPDPILGSPESWGVPLIGGKLARTSAEAVLAAESLGYPVVVKLEARGLDHKTESGGVFLDLRNGVEVEHASESVMSVAATVGLTDAAMRVQRFRPGLEMVVGALHHHSFGPMVSVGFGGVLAEVVEDVAFAPAPVTTETAHAMIDRLRARRLLDGYRGAPPADVGELGRIVSLVSRGIAGHSVQEFEINPLIWDGTEWLAVDVLVA